MSYWKKPKPEPAKPRDPNVPVEVQICPSTSYDPRYQLPPGSKPFGAGFAAVGIGKDIDTGREWKK